MPELPEVEIIRTRLHEKLCGLRLEKVVAHRPDLRWPLPKTWKQADQATLLAVRRRSKYLLLDLDSGYSLLMHLGMSGRLFFSSPKAPLNKHDHLQFFFDAKQELRFRDPRRFGSVHLLPTSKAEQHPLLASLGVEPLSEKFSTQYLHPLLCKSKAPIKSFLMNAHKLVGVGNIYACEALYVAGIHPLYPANCLPLKKTDKLVQAIKTILQKSIAAGGTTFRDYVNADEKPGLHQLDLHVYGRAGQSCHACAATVQNIVLTGRSTFFCPACQTRPG